MRISAPSLPVRIISHNIRYAAEPPSKGELPWAERCPRLLAQLRYTTREIPQAFVCLQEVLHHQLQDILNGLNHKEEVWASIGVGRDDGKISGEYSPILYSKSVWKLDHFKTFWLSETPSRPSKGWDAASTRLVTLGVFKHKESGHRLVGMNTHLDDQGVVSRREAAKLIVLEAITWTDYQSWPSTLPLFLAGDMNSAENDEAYQTLTSKGSPLQDLKRLCSAEDLYGFEYTWTGFDGKGGDEGLKRIDFVFCGHREADWWTAKGHSVLSNVFDDGVFLSDHRAVVGDMLLNQAS